MKLSCTHGHVKAIPHELMLILRALGKLSVHSHKPTVHLKPRKTTKKRINKSYSSLLNLNQSSRHPWLPSFPNLKQNRKPLSLVKGIYEHGHAMTIIQDLN